jgi:Tol biopolymer transport system component
MSISSAGEMAVGLNSRSSGGFLRSGTLARIGITGGGAPRELASDVQFADWSPDGQTLAITRDHGGKTELEFPLGKAIYSVPGWLSHPRISPDGKSIALLHHPVRGDDGGFVELVDIATGKSKVLTKPYASIGGLAWRPDGREVWFAGARIGFNRYLNAASTGGTVRNLAEATGGLTVEDISKEGRTLVVQDKARQGMLGLPPGGTKEIEMSWLDWSLPADLSRDGTLLLFDESGEGGGSGYSVYVRKLDGSPAVRLGEGSAQFLSPDASQAGAVLQREGRGVIRIYPTGIGQPTTLEIPELSVDTFQWTEDGAALVISGAEPGRGLRLYVRDFASGKLRAFSPEGYRLAGSGTYPGRAVLAAGPDRRRYLYSLEGGEPTALTWFENTERISGWSTDGKSAYIQPISTLPATMTIVDVASGKREPWKTLMPSDASGVTTIGGVRVARGGIAYVYSFVRNLADLYVVEGLK